MDPQKDLQVPFLTRKMLAFEEGVTFSLDLQLITDQASGVEIRGFTREGPFTYRFIPAGSGLEEIHTFRIPDIPIKLSIFTEQGTGGAFFCYAVVHLSINGNRMYTLCQGHLSNLLGLSWPDIGGVSPVQINGPLTETPGAVPAAGAEINDSVPAGQIWEIFAIVTSLVTSATVADRTVKLTISYPIGGQMMRVAAATQQASEDQEYTFVPDGTTQVIVANTSQEIALPAPLILGPGTSIGTITTNIQVGDAYTAAAYNIRRTYQSI